MSTAPLRTRDNIVIAAAFMKRGSPRSWSEFEAAFNALCTEVTTMCVQAPPDRLKNAQGRAQQLEELRQMFASCVEEAQKLEAKMKERR